MQTIRQLAGSILLALLSALLVIGGISLALAESYIPAVSPTETRTHLPIFISPIATSALPSVVATASLSSTPSETLPPPPSSCPPPSGWVATRVQPFDTLASLALQYRTTPELLSQANCLVSSDLTPDTLLYVPPVPTQTVVPCGPPPGWILYTVQAGNTMYSLSQAFGVSVAQLQQANCMPYYQTSIKAGQQIWVPNVATRTPTLTPVSIIFPTLTWTASVVPSDTKTPTLEPTLPPTQTQASSPTLSPTAPPSATPTTPPTATPTITAFPSSSP
ncbi:MAG: LysM peptidoglycan-binding domain-containing protein [Chloroflexota bacterium]